MVARTKGLATGITACVQSKCEVYNSDEGTKTSPASCYLEKIQMEFIVHEVSCVDNYLTAVHNDLFINLRLGVSPLKPLVCVYSRFIHIDIEEP